MIGRVIYLTVALLLGRPALAGPSEERLVEGIARDVMSVAQRGTSSQEAQAFLAVINQKMDGKFVAESAFGDRWSELSWSQQGQAQEALMRGSAIMFATALDGSEKMSIDGSERRNGGVVVRTTLTAPVDGLREGIPVDWLVSNPNGVLRIRNIFVAGRSGVDAQKLLVQQLFEISNGRVEPVLQALSNPS